MIIKSETNDFSVVREVMNDTPLVWEGRINFKDEEYWCEEMETIPELWKQIEAIVKERIKSDNPEYGYFDK